MKTTIITLAIALCSTCAFAQNKHLPPTITLKLTAQEVLRLDSAVNYANSTIDSKNASKWFMGAFGVVYRQISEQLVSDSVKVVKPK